VHALALRPAVIASAPVARLIVNLFKGVLAHVANHERAGAAAADVVKAPPPWIAQPQAPDLLQDVRAPCKRIRGRNVVSLGVARRNVHVDAQHLAEQRLRVLREIERIIARAAVTHTDVEKSVGTEDDVAAIVIREWLGDESLAAGPLQIEPGRRVGAERVAGLPRKTGDDGVPLQIDEVHVHTSARRVVRRKRQSEQALFAFVNDQGS